MGDELCWFARGETSRAKMARAKWQVAKRTEKTSATFASHRRAFFGMEKARRLAFQRAFT